MPLFVLAHFSHHLVGSLLTPLLPFIRSDFTLNKTQVGALGTAYNLPYGLAQLPGGWLADRVGPRKLILVGISGVAAAGLLVGIAPTYLVMAIFLGILGLSGGGYHPAAAPLVSASVEEQNRGRALGLHQIGGTASFFLTPLIAAGIAAALGWRGSFISLAIPTFVFGIALYFILGRRGYTDKPQSDTTKGDTEVPAVPGSRRRLIIFTLLGVVLQVLVFSSLSFVPLYANEVLGTSEAVAASLLAVAHFAGLWAGPLGGYLSDRLGKVPVILTVSLLAGPAIYFINQVSPGWSIWLLLLVLGSCQYIGMPVSEAYIIKHTPERNRSTMLGIYYFASRGGPGVIMPALGYLIDNYSYETCFTITGATMAVVAVLCAVFLWGKRD
ncbi:MAG: MFS transporter [Dehalococcoidales bacterium]|nr:MAG: MFS transporter [Dehalococcoidales bacterium]